MWTCTSGEEFRGRVIFWHTAQESPVPLCIRCTQARDSSESPADRFLMRFHLMIQALSFIIKKAPRSVRPLQCVGTGRLAGHFPGQEDGASAQLGAGFFHFFQGYAAHFKNSRGLCTEDLSNTAVVKCCSSSPSQRANQVCCYWWVRKALLRLVTRPLLPALVRRLLGGTRQVPCPKGRRGRLRSDKCCGQLAAQSHSPFALVLHKTCSQTPLVPVDSAIKMP